MTATPIDFSDLRFLIIDDIASFCSALRTMVQSFGVDRIDMVHRGEDAIRALSKHDYDVVLCDYNLGDGKHGNDVLEEAKIHGLLKSAALYVMLTAENAGDMVRGALEYQPDDYLAKPFTKELLGNRLQRLLQRNQVFAALFEARDSGDIAEAIRCCEPLADQYPRYLRHAQKLKSQLLLEAGAYQDAELLLRSVVAEKPLPWARLGLGKSYYYQELITEAEETFRGLLSEDQGYVQAWDWLARCQAQRGDRRAAQASLEQAAKISPINVRRQLRLGDLAIKNGDDERAERAYSRAVKVGRHSVFRAADSYLKLADILLRRLDGCQGLAARRRVTKALESLDEVRRLYRHDSEISLRSRLAEYRIYHQQGQSQDAEKAIYRAYDLCNQDPDGRLPAALKEQLIGALQALGAEQRVKTLVTAMQQEESSHNADAIRYYEQGELEKALRMMKKALQEKPRSYAICLNAAQIAIHYRINRGQDQSALALAASALQGVADLTPTDSRYPRYQHLRKRYDALCQQGV